MSAKRTMREVAEQAFRRINDDAPADVPTWEQLHRVEREHLVRFARAVLDVAGDDVEGAQ
jgi:hypothetical protein